MRLSMGAQREVWAFRAAAHARTKDGDVCYCSPWCGVSECYMQRVSRGGRSRL